jgi:hypothetical protein
MRNSTIWILLVLSLPGLKAFADAAYCDPSLFSKREVKYPNPPESLENLHIFKVGRVYLGALGIDAAKVSEIKDLVKFFSVPDEAKKSCFWYVNKGNKEAQRILNHFYLKNPKDLKPDKAVKEYLKIIGPSFSERPANFVACAESQSFVAVGCNAGLHRSPTVVGMILAYSGCSPESADQIINETWGLNDIKPEVRLSIIKGGYDFGLAHLQESEKLKKLFSEKLWILLYEMQPATWSGAWIDLVPCRYQPQGGFRKSIRDDPGGVIKLKSTFALRQDFSGSIDNEFVFVQAKMGYP